MDLRLTFRPNVTNLGNSDNTSLTFSCKFTIGTCDLALILLIAPLSYICISHCFIENNLAFSADRFLSIPQSYATRKGNYRLGIVHERRQLARSCQGCKLSDRG